MKNITTTIGMATLVLNLLANLCGAASLWSVQTLPTGAEFRAVTYGAPGGNPLFVAVGDSGQIYTSPNATTWSQAPSTINENIAFYAVAYGLIGSQGYFVAVGDLGGQAAVEYSTNGLNWQAGTLQGSPPTLYGVAYGVAADTAQFVAVGINGTIIISTDGKTWGAAASGIDSSEYFYSVAYGMVGGNGGFVAAGANGDESYSWTGSGSWTEGGAGLDDGASGIVYADSQFVAVGYDYGFCTSTDGSQWTQTGGGGTAIDFGPGIPITYGSVNGNGTFVAVAAVAVVGAGVPDVIFTSRSGNCNWTEIETDAGQPLYGIIYTNGLFVAVGGNGTIVTSTLAAAVPPPQMNWVIAPYAAGVSDTVDGFSSVCAGPSEFVAVGYDADTNFASSNGFQWSQSGKGLDNGELTCVEYGNGLYVAADYAGDIYTSSAGSNWTQRLVGSGTNLNGAASGNGYTLAVGENGTILECPEGSVSPWSPRTSGVSENLNAVCFGAIPGILSVAVGDNGTLLTTGNTTTWTSRASGTLYNLYAVTFGGGKYVAVGQAGTILTSTNGQDWNAPAVYYSGIQDLYAVAFGNEAGNPLFVAVGEQGWTATSSDGTHWVGESSATANNLRSIAYNNGTFSAVGDNGTIMESVAPTMAITPVAPPGSFRLSLTGWPNSTVQVEFSFSLGPNTTWYAWGTASLDSTGAWLSSVNGDSIGTEFLRAFAVPACQ